MLHVALDALLEAGVSQDAITVMPVPGAFELPLAAMALAKTRRYACIVALGAIVRGETPHFEYVAEECASGLQLAGIETGVPVAFGVLTVDTVEQAEARIPKAADASAPRSRWPTCSPGSGPAPSSSSYTGRRHGQGLRNLRQEAAFGNHRSHSMVATKRRFDPNLQRVRMLLTARRPRAYVCTRCLKGNKVVKAV